MNYIKISKYDTANGIGIGVVLWVSGCNCHCHGCHNPQTWNFNAGQPFTEDTMQKLLEALDKPYISRLTLSGGHPLDPKNIDTISKITSYIRTEYPNKMQWLYTGYTWEFLKCIYDDKENDFNAYVTNVLSNINVLVDGRYKEDKRDISLAWRGSSNQRVIDVQKSLKQNKIILYCD